MAGTVTEEPPAPPKEILSLETILESLSRPIPDRFIKRKRKGGADIDFVSWYDLQKLLNYNTNGHWESEIVKMYATPYSYEKEKRDGKVSVSDTALFVVVRITITTTDGKYSREATGNCDFSDSSYGDVSSNAEAMAFRRCCAKWGLGLHMWEKDD